jgi:hypothetical protein
MKLAPISKDASGPEPGAIGVRLKAVFEGKRS